MSSGTVVDTIVLGAMTGMRSMSGPATLAQGRGGVMPRLLPLLAAGEMLADKTLAIGNRTDAIPLGGRAVMGAAVGYVLAEDAHQNPVLGAAFGAAVAVAAAHLIFQLRKRLPVPNMAAGLMEDGLVLGLSRLYSRRAS